MINIGDYSSVARCLELEQELEDTREQLRRMFRKVDTVEKVLKQVTLEKEALQEKLRRREESELSNKIEMLNLLSTTHDCPEKVLREQITTLQEEKSVLLGKLEHKNRIAEETNADLRRSKALVRDLSGLNFDLQMDLQAAKRKIRSLDEWIGQMDEKYNDVARKLSRAEEELSAPRASEKELQEEVADLRMKVEEMEEKEQQRLAYWNWLNRGDQNRMAGP